DNLSPDPTQRRTGHHDQRGRKANHRPRRPPRHVHRRPGRDRGGAVKACSIEDCENGGQLRRGLCNRHYKRWRRHGDPLAGSTKYTDPEAAFLARTEPLCWSDCIVWTGALDSDGYGQLRINGRMVKAHRWAYEREHGPIPGGMVIDHMCFERSCANVDHLRLATRQQNVQSRSGAMPGRKHDLPRGVTREGRGYSARVTVGGVRHHLGTFETVEEASAAAETKRAILFGEFA